LVLPKLSVRSAWFALEIVNADQDFYSVYFGLSIEPLGKLLLMNEANYDCTGGASGTQKSEKT